MPPAKQGKEGEEPMVTVKMPLKAHTAMKLIHKRYNDKGGERLRIGEALWAFITEKDPELAKDATRAAELRGQLAELLGDDDE